MNAMTPKMSPGQPEDRSLPLESSPGEGEQTAINPKLEQALKKAKWRRGFEPPRERHARFGPDRGHGPNIPLRHHQVHGRGQ
jgi:hypothetical protein